MTIIDNRTVHRNYTLPNNANNLLDDVARLISAMVGVDVDIDALYAAVAAATSTVSPHFTGTPTAPTPTPGDNSGTIATTAFIATALVNFLTSPAFLVSPTAPTQIVSDNSTKLANTAFVARAVANLVNSSPASLDTLKELADALGDDANFATTITTLIATKLALSGGTLTGDLGVTSINGGSASGYKNLIVNPFFYIDERNNGVGTTANGAKIVDSWAMSYLGTMILNGYRKAGTKVPYALEFNTLTAEASIAAGDIAYMATAIEGYDVADARWGTAGAKSVAIAFSASFPTAGTYCLAVRNGAANRSYVIPIVVAVANVLNDYEFVVPGDTAGTWDWTNGPGMAISIAMAAGATYKTASANTWVAGNFIATTAQANGVATVNNKMSAENFRCNVGNKAIPTEWLAVGKHLQRTRRYYGLFQYSIYGYTTAGSYVVYTDALAIRMRTTPTFTVVSAGTATNTGTPGEAAIGVDAVQLGCAVGSTGPMSLVSRLYSLSAEMV